MSLILDDKRLLPPGIHDATMEDIERHFALSGRRKTLLARLSEYVSNVRLTGWACQVLIDGSFVMPKVIEPNDIDIILVMPPGWDMERRDLKPYEYNVVDRSYTRRTYRIEAFSVAFGSEHERSFIDLFSKSRIEWCKQFGLPAEFRKGIVRLVQ